MAYELVYFSDARLELQKELAHQDHEELWHLVSNHPPQEFELRLAEIATYCELILDDYYSQEDLDKICDILTKRLRDKRGALVVVSSLH